ncbi:MULTISPECIES: thiol reductant ABC exporter subunit CydD [unclassified Variovorax]|uniref:thiol reductant ABC exporter subunit CydD n=1 Tax=unclassified Variovorax TaxID=663243 RepID=UPI000D127618|nr:MULTISPECIES: thiol reductant ABC exporter subunit CydD [unclassified Variovorax]AVQ79703.1 thiol reductant ABC exporter subunit CydD [Variovorax sp. PMC12]QRY30969.1 thiol reductant ABC exporter subunit CydD [Variovorax sp. PDNC026]
MAQHSHPRSPLKAFASPDVGGVVQGAAALLWLPQAALLAMAVQGLASGQGLRAVWLPAGAILLLGLLRAACEAWGARRTFGRARARLSALRAQTAEALADGSPLDRGRAPSGKAASVLAEQAEALVPYLVRYQPARWRATVVPVFILGAVACFSWVAALVLLVAAPLIPIFMAIVGWRAKAASEAQMVEMGSMNAFLLDRLRGLATLRALDAVDATAHRLGDAAQSLRVRTMSVLRIAFLSSAVMELFSALGVAMVAAYVGFHLLGSLGFGTWGRTLSLGEGLFVLLLAPAFFEPLRELSAVWHDRAAGEAALQALDGLQQNTLPLPGASASLKRAATGAAGAAPAVAVHGLHFSWPGETNPVFDGLELRVAAGEHIALAGPSGSGKTALLSLLAGLVPAARGEISIGGVPLTDHTVAALRQRMAWMGQAPHVFAGSVEANVALGREDVGTPRVAEAMRFASLDAVAQAHPGTALGEGGRGLSGGEAVRLALARIAVHPHADLLLVDEPTAHLDSETAARVADALVELARGKTLIVATHDPALAARMDRVVSLGAQAMEKAA